MKYNNNILSKKGNSLSLYNEVQYVDYRDPKTETISTLIKKGNLNLSDEDLKYLIKQEQSSESLGLHIQTYGKEIKIIANKRSLEKIINNLPNECMICESDFSKENFYLIEMFDGCGSETYVECLCKNYRECVSEYNG